MIDDALVPEDHVILLFGANGDLARRKLLPALFHLTQEGLMPRRFFIIGNSRSEMSDDEFTTFARSSVDEFCRCEATDSSWHEFSERLSYVSHEFRSGDTEPVDHAVRAAEAELGGQPRRLFYLAVPPPVFAVITQGLGACGLAERARVIYEKPYGLDLDSFRELDDAVHAVLDESQVFRIDHFLGKETVQNILALRFANGMFEPVWNRDHIDHVQIDVPETLGIGTRAGFYEQTGALRDMVVTHLLQVLSFVALEPPTSLAPKPLLDEKVKVFESMVPLQPDDVVRGQFDGYRDVEGVAPDSDTETFVAARFFVDNWRWAGVPFFLRTGKRMAEARSSVVLAFRSPPHQMFREVPRDRFGHDHLALELGPEEGVTATFLAKAPGPTIKLAPARMEFRYQGSFGSELIEAYERLIHDALIGDRTLFTRAGGIRRIWGILADLIAYPPPLHPYPQGSWGPDEATELISPRRWHLPAEQA
jgi:glucose-6-phosphate 1-dehydrogenase